MDLLGVPMSRDSLFKYNHHPSTNIYAKILGQWHQCFRFIPSFTLNVLSWMIGKFKKTRKSSDLALYWWLDCLSFAKGLFKASFLLNDDKVASSTLFAISSEELVEHPFNLLCRFPFLNHNHSVGEHGGGIYFISWYPLHVSFNNELIYRRCGFQSCLLLPCLPTTSSRRHRSKLSTNPENNLSQSTDKNIKLATPHAEENPSQIQTRWWQICQYYQFDLFVKI